MKFINQVQKRFITLVPGLTSVGNKEPDFGVSQNILLREPTVKEVDIVSLQGQEAGFEPSVFGLWVECSTTVLHPKTQ